MFHFTIRDVLGLMAVAGFSCIATFSVAPPDPASKLAAAVIFFGFGGACYIGGIAVGRSGQTSNYDPTPG